MTEASRYRRLLSDECGTVFIEYSSLMLLLAIAAIAVLIQVGDVGVPQSHASKAMVSD